MQKSSDFVNLQQQIELKLSAEKSALSPEPASISAAMHLSSYELVGFLRDQIKRADQSLMRAELNLAEVSRKLK